jgi:hypothetical protein
MLDAAVWQAHVLPFNEKIKLLTTIIKYNQYIKFKTFMVLIIKK